MLAVVAGPGLGSDRGPLNRVGAAMGLGILWPRRFATERPVPYPVIPLTVIAIDMIIATVPLALLLVEMIVQSFASVSVDTLLAKNVLWWFGHPVVYLLLFPAVSLYYLLVPRYAQRALVAGNIIAVGWTIAVIANVTVWAHHLYMDYPNGIQAAINTGMEPLTFARTIVSALSLYSLFMTIFRSRWTWNAASTALFLGIVSWLLAGLSGVVNATIAWDAFVHNTLWVVGHFHHMALLNIGIVIFGATYAFLPQLLGRELYSDRLGIWHVWLTFFAGSGVSVVWIIEGLESAPRRFSQLPGKYDALNAASIPLVAVLGLADLRLEPGRHHARDAQSGHTARGARARPAAAHQPRAPGLRRGGDPRRARRLGGGRVGRRQQQLQRGERRLPARAGTPRGRWVAAAGRGAAGLHVVGLRRLPHARRRRRERHRRAEPRRGQAERRPRRGPRRPRQGRDAAVRGPAHAGADRRGRRVRLVVRGPPLGPAVPGSGHWGVWPGDPLLVPLICAIPVLLYGVGWSRLRRTRRADPLRALAFLAGAQVLVLALDSPLHHVAGHYLLAGHMVQHVLIGDIAPLLLVAGVSGPLVAMLPGRVRRLAGPPWAAFLAWAGVTGGWYVPALFDRAIADPVLHALMQTSIVLAGVAAWAHILGVAARPMSAGRRAGFALALMGVGWVVSEALFLSGPLYAVYIHQPERLFGLSPAADQIRAAVIMGSEGMITMLTAAALLVWAHMDATATDEAELASSRPCAPPDASSSP